MTEGDPIAIEGNLVDIRNVGVHKCVRLIIDIPPELAQNVVATFGWPTGVAPVPVAVARLDKEQQQMQPEKKRRWVEMSCAQQAGIRCGTKMFRDFLREKCFVDANERCLDISDEESAAKAIHYICGVDSRYAIDKSEFAVDTWRKLDSEYLAWCNCNRG